MNPKHRCTTFQRIRDGFQHDIERTGSVMEAVAPRWRERKRIQIDSLKRRMAGQLNRHLATCRECDR